MITAHKTHSRCKLHIRDTVNKTLVGLAKDHPLGYTEVMATIESLKHDPTPETATRVSGVKDGYSLRTPSRTYYVFYIANKYSVNVYDVTVVSGTEDPLIEAIRAYLDDCSCFEDFGRYRIIGDYGRADEAKRHELIQVCELVEDMVRDPDSYKHQYNNFLVCGPSGCGKTALVHELMEHLSKKGSGCVSFSTCLSRIGSAKEMERTLTEIRLALDNGKKVLSFWDEVDTKEGKNWSGEGLFDHAGWNKELGYPMVLFLAVSKYYRKDDVETAFLRGRSKRADLWRRISRVIEIPALNFIDRVIIAVYRAKRVLDSRIRLKRIEKTVLAHIAHDTDFSTARSVEMCIEEAVRRIPAGRQSLCLVDVFDAHDTRLDEFLRRDAWCGFRNSFISLDS